MAELSQNPSHLTNSFEEGWWTLHVDGTSRASSPKVGLVLQSLIEKLLEQAIRLGFPIFNNEVEYETILAELDLAFALVVDKLRIYNDSQLVIEHIQKEYEAKDECMVRYVKLVQASLVKLSELVVEKIH